MTIVKSATVLVLLSFGVGGCIRGAYEDAIALSITYETTGMETTTEAVTDTTDAPTEGSLSETSDGSTTGPPVTCGDGLGRLR